MKPVKLKDGKCPKCGGTDFFADEVNAWKGSSAKDDCEEGEDLHMFKCYESSTENITCVNAKCAAVIDPNSVEVYFD